MNADYANAPGAVVEFESVGLDAMRDLDLDPDDCLDCAADDSPEDHDVADDDDDLTDEQLGALTAEGRRAWVVAVESPARAQARNRRREEFEQEEQSRAERAARFPVAENDGTQRAGRRSTAGDSSGWEDVSLDGILDAVEAGTFTLPLPTVGMLADGTAGLFYPGRVNGVAGESGAGKGWLALSIAAEQMRLRHDAYYLDFEDSPALAALRLVSVLSVDPQLVRSRFHYLHPQRHDPDGIESLIERVAATPDAFVVIDSTGESIAAAGLNQNHDEDVALWMQSLAHPLADRGGACVVLLDHMVKSEDGGLWPIGSQRKRAAITGAQYVVEVAEPFSKTADGMAVLRVAKDRHGAREARSVATFIQFRHPILSTTPTADGLAIVLAETLDVILGSGKTAAQVQADRDARAASALDKDVAALDALTPAPTSYRDVKSRLGWRDSRAQAAMREWKSRAKP
ncbi:MAG TPA: AAA family ATPase [Gaiellaceae bacterium]|jgi:hypothetical protein